MEMELDSAIFWFLNYMNIKNGYDSEVLRT